MASGHSCFAKLHVFSQLSNFFILYFLKFRFLQFLYTYSGLARHWYPAKSFTFDFTRRTGIRTYYLTTAFLPLITYIPAGRLSVELLTFIPWRLYTSVELFFSQVIISTPDDSFSRLNLTSNSEFACPDTLGTSTVYPNHSASP